MDEALSVEQITCTREFSDFYTAATDYCTFIEKDSKVSGESFLQELRPHLLNLYQSALKLQWVDLKTDADFNEKPDAYLIEKTLLLIEEKLGDKRYYWHVFDPTNQDDTEPVCGDLLDDFGDIYKDLKRIIVIYNLGKEDCKEIALWRFKFYFHYHWSDHCINALMAIHYFLQP